MAKAYILVETEVGKTMAVVEGLRSIKGVKSVDPVTGPYDVIVVLEAADLNAIGTAVATNIHPIGGITRTVTCLALVIGPT